MNIQLSPQELVALLEQLRDAAELNQTIASHHRSAKQSGGGVTIQLKAPHPKSQGRNGKGNGWRKPDRN